MRARLSQSAAYRRFLSRGDLRRRRRDRRTRRQQKPVPELVKLTVEEKRRMVERKDYIDAAVAYLANYKWCFFITLTFRETQGAESIERAIKRFVRFIHENVFGEIHDVRDLFGVRYFPAIERGSQGRLHAHLMICGGEILGELLAKARWEPWAKWWRQNYGVWNKIEEPRSQNDVAAYCAKYMLKGEETGFELCSTWADERDRQKRNEAPLIERKKIGVDVVRSAELERAAYRCEAPHGTGPTSKGAGKPCRRCGLVSLCRCWSGTSESGQVLPSPESDAGACESGAHRGDNPAPLSPQMDLRMQQQLVFGVRQASASKTWRLSPRCHRANRGPCACCECALRRGRRRDRLVRRRHRYEIRNGSRCATRSVGVAVNAVCTVENNNSVAGA
jgi:hypothetical protein